MFYEEYKYVQLTLPSNYTYITIIHNYTTNNV